MAISSIYGYGSYNSYQYQTSLNLLRLQSAQSTASAKNEEAVQKITGVSDKKSTYGSVQSFLKSYQSELTSLEAAAAKLQQSSSTNVFNDYKVASTDEDVVTAKETWRLKGDTDITLDVQSLAQAQKNGSVSHYSQEAVEPGADMDFTIASAGGSLNVAISSTNADGSAKTYNQMYQDAAKAINAQSNLGVRASVVNEDGKISLSLTAKDTGAANGFTVTGDTGAAKGIENAAVQAQDAVYTVTENGMSQTLRSDTNTVSLDYGRIEAQLKGTGEAHVYTGVDEDEVVSAVQDLIKGYNSVSSLLESNSGRGTGAAAHLESFNRGLADEKTLKALGITYNKDGDLVLDEDKLKEALREDFEGTRDLLGGQFGIAEKAAQKSDMALSDSVQRIVNSDLSTAQQTSSASSSLQGSLSDSFKYFANFAKSGPYNLSNYYTVGMLLNTLA